MAITKVELANMLLGVESTKKAAAKIKTSAIVGTAHNDSHDGYVLVDLGGDVISVDGKQYVSLATTADVRAGDKVYVLLRGADGTAMGATVIGSAGGGDRTKVDIAAAAAEAAAAKADVSSAISMVNSVKATADAHESQIDAIQKDIAAYKKSATATYATKTDVDEKTGAITKTIEADYTKTTDMESAISAAQTAATDAAKSTVDGMQIGGRNLVLFSDFSGFDPHGVFTVDGDVATATSSAVGNTNNWQCSLNRTSTDYITTVRNKRFTFSMDYWVTEAITYGTKKPFIGAQLWVEYTPDGSTTNKYKYFTWYGDDLFPTAVTSGWVRTSITHTFPDATIVASGFSLYFRDCKGTAKFRHPKLELGNKPTDWTPAPEDVDSAVADAKKAGTDAQNALDAYKTTVSETYAEKLELQQQVNLMKSTMTANYSSFTEYRTSNDTALSKAQTDATNAQSTIDSYKQSNDKAVADAKSAGTTAQNQLSSYKSTNDAAVKDAKKAGTDAQADLDGYKTTTNQRLGELKNIADNAIESFYLKGAPTTSNAPAKSWTTDALKKQHAGDLYMDTDTGYSYRWSGTAWVQVKDSDVTKALTEIANIKTDYATKTELEQTNTSLSAKVEDSLSTAKTYASGLVSTEVTQRNAAITAKANEITQQVSKTYTKSETFSAYQSDADSRIATANSNASTAKSTAQTAASDAATAKTNASSAVSTANSAKSTAQTASTNASNAVNTANSANSKSDSAVSTANSAKSTAASASSTANAAKSTVDRMKLGGRNLLKGTSMDSKAVTTPTTANTTWGSGFAFPSDVAHQAAIPYGAEYRCSADVLLPVDGTIVVDMNTYAKSGTGWTGNDNDNTNKRTPTTFNVKANVWTRLSWGSENTSDANTGKQTIYVNDSVGLLPQSSAVTWHYRGLKVELGNKATDWTPAPEDTDSAVADAKKAGTDAQTSANAAKTAASNAQKAADKAQSSADDTAAALAKAAVRIRIDGTPMADGTSQLMAHVYVGNDEVPASAIAKLGTLVWKMDGVADRRGTTTYTAQTGKFVTCRLEA